MGIFDNNFGNNINLNTSFAPNPYAPQYPFPQPTQQMVQNNPNKPYEIIDNRGNLIGYFWYYGNSIDLIWDIVGEATSETSNTYIDASDIVKSKIVTATIYDWRHQIIDKIKLIPEIINCGENVILATGEQTYIDKKNIIVKLPIKNELSQKMVKGTYTISLTLSDLNGYDETLFDTGICKFEVR